MSCIVDDQLKCEVLFSLKSNKINIKISSATNLLHALKVNPFIPADKYRFCANSVDSDETACNMPSHQDLHSLPFFY